MKGAYCFPLWCSQPKNSVPLSPGEILRNSHRNFWSNEKHPDLSRDGPFFFLWEGKGGGGLHNFLGHEFFFPLLG